MVQEKKTAISLQPLWNNDQPEDNRKENEKGREQEQGSKRLEIVVFCLFIGETYSQELPQSCMIFKIQSDIQV